MSKNALSFGSGDTSLWPRTSTNSASSLSRLMISPTRFRRTPSLVRTPLYSETISSVTSQVKVPSSSQSRRSEALGFSTARRDLNPATTGDEHRRVDHSSRLFFLDGPTVISGNRFFSARKPRIASATWDSVTSDSSLAATSKLRVNSRFHPGRFLPRGKS